MSCSIQSGGNFGRWMVFYAAAAIYNLVWANKKVQPVEEDSSISPVTEAVKTVAGPVVTGAGIQVGTTIGARLVETVPSMMDGTCPAVFSKVLALPSVMSKAVALVGSMPTKAAQTAQIAGPAARLALPFAAAESTAGAAGTAGASAGSYFSGFASAAAGAAESAYGAASGAASSAYGAAQGAFGWAASTLSYSQMALGGLGLLGTAWLVYKYWKGSGAVNVINSANNTNTVNNHIHVDAKPGMEVVQEKQADGSVKLTVKGGSDEELRAGIAKLVDEIRAQRLAPCAAA